MRINPTTNYNISKKQNFGLKIHRDKEFYDFLDYAQESHRGCNRREINKFISRISNINYPGESKKATTIAFGPIYEETEVEPITIHNDCFFFSYDSDGVREKYYDCLPYTFFDSSEDPIDDDIDMDCFVRLNGNSLSDIAAEILDDYIRYKNRDT